MTRAAVLSDEVWAQVERLLSPVKGAMGRPMKDHRALVGGVIYRYRTGIAWRDLPAEFGSWQTVWKPLTGSQSMRRGAGAGRRDRRH